MLLTAKSDPHSTSNHGRTPLSDARLFIRPAKIDGIRETFLEHGVEETPCEARLWGLRLLKDDNEQYWRARTSDVELTPHVGHTHVGL